MERKDFFTAYDPSKKRVVNVGGLQPSERFGMKVRHEVQLTGTPEEIGLLRQGLRTLRAMRELEAATHGSTSPLTEPIERLDQELGVFNVAVGNLPYFVRGQEEQQTVN